MSSLVDFSSLISAATPEARDAAANDFAKKIKSVGMAKAASAGTLEKLVAELADKAKGKADARAGVFAGLTAILSELSTEAEPFLAPLLPKMIEGVADKLKHVSTEAEKTANTLADKLSPNGVAFLMPMILADADGKWQSNLLRAQLCSTLAKKHPAQTQRCLVAMIPVISGLMWDTKAQVKAAASDAMKDVTDTMDNTDLREFVPEVIGCILEPGNVPECVHKLAGVVFVQEIYGSALAVMAPLLQRGFGEPTTSIKRNCARITENMAKLVDDPYEVEPFVPMLLPCLERAKEEVSDPECRTVCEKAYDQLKRTAEQPPIWRRISVSEVSAELAKQGGGVVSEGSSAAAAYAAALAHSLLDLKNLDGAAWEAALVPVLKAAGATSPSELTKKLLESCAKHVKVEEAAEEADDAEQLCDCKFSLAYGNKVLLNQTQLKLKRGFRYGLCGRNDSGKTSLMRAIANQQVEGFPPPSELRTMFVETEVQGDLSEYSVLDFVTTHAGLQKYGVTEEMAREMLLSVGFDVDDSKMAPASLTKQVGRLSGGWRMKLALCRAMLMKADILLLDEPTNHLDPGNVKWVIDYLTSLTQVTSIIVSHDIKVLDQVCTHVLQIDSLKLKLFKGNLSYVADNFVPDLRTYFELKASKFSMRFPQPGALEGVASKGKHIMKMTNITFTYPNAPKPQLTGVTVRVSLSTRAACIGANGAGKSTMIKLLTGELQADKGSGDVWKHPNARVAYVAQHAFHHIESHLEKTPNEYIRWRYEYGSDKEGLEKVTAVMTEEEEKKIRGPLEIEYKDDEGNIKKAKLTFKRFTEGRRTISKSKDFEYEVMWQSDITTWVSKEKLVKLGFEKLLKHVDDKIAAMATQLVRPLTHKFVEQHIADVGLEPEFGSHFRMGALSGGQKVKVVLAASMWNTPHIVILDEPTNYLDRDSLGALAEAIRAYDGGVVIISHNAQFVDQVCPEVWHLENHTLNLKGSYDWLESANKEAVKQAAQEDTYTDGLGNEVTLEKRKKKATKADLKKIKKLIAEKRKQGIECFTDEELEEAGFMVEEV